MNLHWTCVSVFACLLFATQLRALDVERFRPAWKTGDAWIVEVTQQNAIGRGGSSVRWRFEVANTETVGGREVWRLDLALANDQQRTIASVWYDKSTKTLRQYVIRVTTPAGPHTVKESYGNQAGQPFPAIAGTMTLPIGVPLFLDGMKSAQSFSYVAAGGNPQEKSVGKVAFAHEVMQQFAVAPSSSTTVRGDELVVVLRSAGRTVRQRWRVGEPWPIYSDNGVTQSKLASRP